MICKNVREYIKSIKQNSTNNQEDSEWANNSMNKESANMKMTMNNNMLYSTKNPYNNEQVTKSKYGLN